jgi:hypothetical protein
MRGSTLARTRQSSLSTLGKRLVASQAGMLSPTAHTFVFVNVENAALGPVNEACPFCGKVIRAEGPQSIHNSWLTYIHRSAYVYLHTRRHTRTEAHTQNDDPLL